MTEIDTGPVPVRIYKDPADEYEIDGYGFTISRVATDSPTQQLLPHDPMRLRAIIFTNASAAFLGTRAEMATVSAQMGSTDGGPGARLPAGNFPAMLTTQNEVWVGFTGIQQVSVWVERKVPRARR